MSRDTPVVELIGPPGSGKSAVASALGGLPGVVVVKDHDVGDVPVLIRSAASAGRLLLATPPPGVTRRRWIAWLGRTRAAPAVVRRRLAAGARSVVLDQGPAYTLGRIAGAADASRAVTRWRRARMADCRRLLDAAVWLDAEPTLLAERLRSRPKRHHLDDLATDATLDALERERTTARLVIEALAATGVPVLDLDAHRPLVDNVAAVRALLAVDTTGVDGIGRPS